MNQPGSLLSEYSHPGFVAVAGATENPSSAREEFSRYGAHLSRMAEQLKQTSAQIEDSVMQVCMSFQGIALQAKTTVNRGQAFLSQGGSDGADGGFDSLIRRCGDTFVKVLSVTEESGAVSRRAIDRIVQMEAASKVIGEAMEELDQIASSNRLMALNARIEAAHAGDKGSGFVVVAVEVAAQTERSQKVTARVGDVVEQLRALAASTLADLEQMLERDVIRVEQCRQDVEGSLRDLRSAHATIKSVVAGMAEDGERLTGEIGLAIRGMQFQDRVSQRIAHVVEDLDTLRDRLSKGPSNGVPDDAGFSAYTMVEERVVAGLGADESAAGDVELF